MSGTVAFTISYNDYDPAPLQKILEGLTPEAIIDPVAAVMFNRVRTRFLAQQTPDGVDWEQSQAAMMEKRQTLFDTGRLYRSIQLYREQEGKAAIGTDVPYAQDHNNGENGQVQREFLGFSEQDEQLAYLIVEAQLTLLMSGDQDANTPTS